MGFPVLLMFSLLFILFGVILSLIIYFLQNHVDWYSKYWQITQGGILLVVNRIPIFMPYHELIHYYFAEIFPIAEPQEIFWQMELLRPTARVYISSSFSLNPISILEFLLIRLSPVLIGLLILTLLWPVISVIADEVQEIYAVSSKYTKSFLILAQMLLIISGSISDIASSINFCNRMIQNNHLNDAVLAFFAIILLLIIGLVICIMITKAVIEPRVMIWAEME